MRNVTETGAVANLPQAMSRRKLRPHGVKMGLRLCALAGVMMLFTTSVALCQNLGPCALTKIADLNSGPGFLSISGPSITRNESVNIVLSSGCPSTTTSGPSVVFSASVNPTGEGIYVGGPNQPGLTTIVQGSYGLEHGGINPLYS